eukprot:m.129164 g.129164  ORF g.129164 m.129164 type:complete len:690 (-) comp9459_c1_seq4:9600-11669(-)
MSQFNRSNRATSAKSSFHGGRNQSGRSVQPRRLSTDILQGFHVSSAVTSTKPQPQGFGTQSLSPSLIQQQQQQSMKYLQQQQHVQQIFSGHHLQQQQPQQHQQPISSSSHSNRPRTASSPQDSITTYSVSTHGPELLVVRTEEEKAIDPDRMNLDNQELKRVPILKHEQQLRLLNLQHNAISRISNMDYLPNLIFLDLYNNNIQNFDGIEYARHLRVLMLGKNNISSLSGLNSLHHLDVLDLHGNNISSVSELSSITTLRVLNLASNNIKDMSPLGQLRALVELNLRKNKIEQLVNFPSCMPYLQRLFLSDNIIQSFNEVFKHDNLAELSFDGNDKVTSTELYRETVIFYLPSLRLLDNKRVSSEERRMAGITIRRVEEKQKQAIEAARMKQLRESEVLRIKECWTKYNSYSIQTSSLYDQILTESLRNREQEEGVHDENDNLLGFLWVAQDVIHCYGHIDRLLNSVSIQSSQKTITFEHVEFSTIVDGIGKIRKKLPGITTVSIKGCNVTHLYQLACLSSLNLTSLNIDADQEPICSTRLWERYIAMRLQPHGVVTLNNQPISLILVGEAARMFSSLSSYCSKIPINHSINASTFPVAIPSEMVEKFKDDVQRSIHQGNLSATRSGRQPPTFSQSQLLRITREGERELRERVEAVLNHAIEGLQVERKVRKMFAAEKAACLQHAQEDE